MGLRLRRSRACHPASAGQTEVTSGHTQDGNQPMTTAGTLQDGHDQAQSRPGQVQGRVALVTGGTRGIGAAICRALAADGADVAAGYWRGDGGAEVPGGLTGEYPGPR